MDDMKNYVLPVFSGDFAARYPKAREYFTLEMAEQWGKMLDALEAEPAA